MKPIAIRLKDGQDLKLEIEKLAKEKSIQAGIILSGVGSLRESKIRVPVIDKNVKYITQKDLEIDSLHGTVSEHGSHIHITVSDIDGKVMGGHLTDGCIVRTTCEVVIGVLDGLKFERRPDPDTGFDELTISELK